MILRREEKGALATDSHSILARWLNHFFHLLNVHGDSDDRQIEIHAVEPLVPEPSSFEVELAMNKLKKTQIPAELIKYGVEKFALRSISLLIRYGMSKLPEKLEESINISIYKKGNITECSNYGGISSLSTVYKI
jgi:hypothetical protein